VLFLLDTGVRASELRGLTMSDLDMESRSCRILGKGQKYRTCYFGATTAKALSRYLRMKPRTPRDPVFIGHSGSRTGKGLLASSLFHILERMAKSAGLEDVEKVI
jgi:site-specific recombinase XerD